MNEEGFSVSGQILAGSQYQDLPKKYNAKEIMPFTCLTQWALGNFRTIDELLKGRKASKGDPGMPGLEEMIVFHPMPAFGAVNIHWMINDSNGRNIVLEYFSHFICFLYVFQRFLSVSNVTFLKWFVFKVRRWQDECQ